MNLKISHSFAVILIITFALFFGVEFYLCTKTNKAIEESNKVSQQVIDVERKNVISNKNNEIDNSEKINLEEEKQVDKKYNLIESENGENTKLVLCGKEIAIKSISDLEKDGSIIYITKDGILKYAKVSCPLEEQKIIDLKDVDSNNKFDLLTFFESSDLIHYKGLYFWSIFASGPGDLMEIFIFSPKTKDYILALEYVGPDYQRMGANSICKIVGSKSKKMYYLNNFMGGNNSSSKFEDEMLFIDYYADNKKEISQNTKDILEKYYNYFPDKFPLRSSINPGTAETKDVNGYLNLSNNKIIEEK
jgi:hypothetical protein